MLDAIIENSWIFYTLSAIIGACVGSFLNVVIYRLPIMLERAWKQECREMFNVTLPQDEPAQFNLCVPPSRCPQCQMNIPFYWNIPIISYLMLRGRCFCDKKAPIGKRYLIVEFFTMAITLFTAYTLGPNIQMVAACFFTWILIALLCIDLDHYILPDNLNLGLLWLGLIVNLYDLFVPLPDAVLGAIMGYASLWIFANIFYLFTKKEGMGQGDFKLFAALGAWMGWHQLLLIIIFSSLVGALVGLSLIVFQGREKAKPIPFGPFLAIAGWIAFYWGDSIMHEYYDMLGLSF